MSTCQCPPGTSPPVFMEWLHCGDSCVQCARMFDCPFPEKSHHKCDVQCLISSLLCRCLCAAWQSYSCKPSVWSAFPWLFLCSQQRVSPYRVPQVLHARHRCPAAPTYAFLHFTTLGMSHSWQVSIPMATAVTPSQTPAPKIARLPRRAASTKSSSNWNTTRRKRAANLHWKLVLF